MFKGIKNQAFRFILNFFILVLILVFIDRVAGRITKHYYYKQVAGANYRTTYAMDSTTADILVFGSSRANHHYVPEVFEDSLKMSFYNTGRDGNFLLFNYAVFQSVLKRYNPKIIILDINPENLYYNKDDYDRLSSLLPYYNDHPEIQSIVKMRGPYEKYKLLSAIYPFNSSLLTIVIGNLEYNKIRKGDNKGYVPSYNQMKDTIVTTVPKPNSILDTTALAALASIANTCKANHIRLLLIHSPWYVHADKIESSKILNQLASKYGAEFLDFSNDSLFMKNPSWFKDKNHLNNTGATKFSAILAGILAIDKTHKLDPITGAQ